MKRRVTSVLVAAATVMCASAAAVQGGFAPIVDLGISASAANGVGYINSTGDYKTCSSYDRITSSTTKLTGGWYVVDRNVTLSNRLNVTGDANLILMEGCTLTAKKGINVSNASKFNVYTQDGGSGRLFAGTTNGSTSTADSGRCGLGGSDATINIIGGQVYAVGGSGASGIMGEVIRLYWTNPEDLVYASSYSSAARLQMAFVDTKNKKAFGVGSQSAASVKGVTLHAANTINSDTTYLENGTYVASGNVTNRNRIVVENNVNIILTDNAVLKAPEGITVASGDSLNISGKGTLYAGTSSGSASSAASNNAGIGSENGGRAGDIIIESGKIYAAGGRNASAIGGTGAYVEIDGGNVSATAGTNGTGIGGSNANIRLSWTNSSDSIYASSYNGSVNFGKTMYLEGTGENAQRNNIAGQTLVTSSRVSTCRVTFESNGGSYVTPISVGYNSYLNNLPTPTKKGYLFDGWYTDRYFNNYFNVNTRITSNLTLYAKWTNGDCRVTFNANGGRMVDGRTTGYADVNYNGYVYEPVDPTRSGYTFTGWYTDSACRYLYNFNSRVTSNMTLYAGWSDYKNYLTIKFNSMGGTSIPNMTIDYGATLNTRGLGTPTKSGYIFDAWYYDRGCTFQVDCFNDKFFEDTTLYAGWIKQTSREYTISYDSMGGSYVSSRKVAEGDPIGASELSYRDGYEFLGWFTDRNCRTMVNIDTPVYSNITLYAGWSSTAPKYLTVSYDSMGGSFVMSRNIAYGDCIGASEMPYRDGYEFTGWYTNSSCTTIANINTPIYNDITLYAGWVKNVPVVKTYTLTFYLDNQYLGSQEVEEGRCAVNMYGNYSWTNNYDGGPFDFNSPVYRNMDLFAYSNTGINDTYNNNNDDWWYAGSTFGGAGLIAAIAGGAVVIGGGVAAGVVLSKKKKNGKSDDKNGENK